MNRCERCGIVSCLATRFRRRLVSTRKTKDLPAWLERVRQRFERWRQTRVGRAPIPDSLWASAVRMARRYGVHRTAKALKVDYYSLKDRVEGKAGTSRRRNGQAGGGSKAPLAVRSSAGSELAEEPGSAFLELPPAGGGGECLVELESAAGAKMRIHLKGVTAPDLVALSRSFWKSSRDPGYSSDAHPGRRGACGFPQRNRWLGSAVPGETSARPFRWLCLRVSQSRSDRPEDPCLRWPRILAVSQAVFPAAGSAGGRRAEPRRPSGWQHTNYRSSSRQGNPDGSQAAPAWRPVGPAD